jgi:serine/threonine protein kinase
VVHRDLRLENILVVKKASKFEESLVKIIDFNASNTIKDKDQIMNDAVGNINYIAPEIIDG